MDDQTNETNSQETQQDEISRDDLELLGLDDFFDGLEPHMTLVISRLEPSEFKGVLEEIEIEDPSNPISLNYLINKWGGHKLLLRLRRKRGNNGKGKSGGAGTWVQHRVVNLYSYPPLRFGKPLRRSMDFQGVSFEDEPRQEKKPENTMETMLGVAQMMQQMRSSELQTLATLLGSLHQPQVQQQNAQPDPFSQASKMLSLFGQMQSMTAPPQAQGEGDEVLGLLGKLAETFAVTQKTANTPAPALVAHNPESKTPQGIISNLRSDFLKLPGDQQAETLQLLFSQLQQAGGEDLMLRSLENLGILGSDDDETEDAAIEDPRGEPRSNEGDDPPNR